MVSPTDPEPWAELADTPPAAPAPFCHAPSTEEERARWEALRRAVIAGEAFDSRHPVLYRLRGVPLIGWWYRFAWARAARRA